MECEMKIVNIPLTSEELKEVLKEENNGIYAINFKGSIEKLGNNHPTKKFLNYIYNCELENILIVNHDFNDDFEQLMLDYISYNEKLTISLLSELWNMIIFGYDDTDERIDQESKDFIHCFRNKHLNYIKEIKTFLFSLLMALTNVINSEDETSSKLLSNAQNNKLRLCGVNIVSLNCATEFYKNWATLVEDKEINNKAYIYDEFVKDVLDGGSITYHFITENTPFRTLYIISQLKNNPDSDMANDIINKINSTLAKE